MCACVYMYYNDYDVLYIYLFISYVEGHFQCQFQSLICLRCTTLTSVGHLHVPTLKQIIHVNDRRTDGQRHMGRYVCIIWLIHHYRHYII